MLCSSRTSTPPLLPMPPLLLCLAVQAGRAGRRSQASLSLYVAFDGPLDQHFMAHPQELFQRPIECVQVRMRLTL
jgi:DEAD/DEAH box helicase domain-containing protein